MLLLGAARRAGPRAAPGARAAAGRRRFAHGGGSAGKLGFIGLGKIGSGMLGNLARAGRSAVVHDRDPAAQAAVIQANGPAVSGAGSVAEVAEHLRSDGSAAPSVVFTVVPDDRVLGAVSEELLPALGALGGPRRAVHVSCSTVSPATSRAWAEAHAAAGVGFVAAPVFARPDGMRRGEATVPVSGPAWAKEAAIPLLRHTAGGVHDFGEDAGAANVVKLGGNFLIAAAIEALAEASALAESHGVDREQFVSLMNSTIFDCLIYRGYGHRVAARDHFPHPDAHFALDLGSKDVALVHDSAIQAKCPMPVASLLRDRFMAAQNAGRGKLDWSALALRASEDAGADVSARLAELLESTKTTSGA